MKRSENIGKLSASLAKAQIEFEAAGREHTAKVAMRNGGTYSFNYADLAAYLDVCRKPLGNNGLSYVQEATVNGNKVSVVTLLSHESGEFIEAEPLVLTVVGVGDNNVITPQAVGSGITYARRYSLSALIGMASEADDDGNAASGNNAETARREDKPSNLPECPKCKSNKATIIGKPEFGGGFVCFAKKDGCGYKWKVGETNGDAEQTNGHKTTPDRSENKPQNGTTSTPTKVDAVTFYTRRLVAKPDATTLNSWLPELKALSENEKVVIRGMVMAYAKESNITFTKEAGFVDPPSDTNGNLPDEPVLPNGMPQDDETPDY